MGEEGGREGGAGSILVMGRTDAPLHPQRLQAIAGRRPAAADPLSTAHAAAQWDGPSRGLREAC